jgi:hypothetical protein
VRNMPREEMIRRIQEMKESGHISKLMGNLSSNELLDAFLFFTDRFVAVSYTHACRVMTLTIQYACQTLLIKRG